jgi:branched-chain amino acid transport system substrate-binding protein
MITRISLAALMWILVGLAPISTAGAATPIKLALLVPNSGRLAVAAMDLLAGARACASVINRDGGIRGNPVEIEAFAHGIRAKDVVDLTQRLGAANHIVAILSPVGPVTNAVLLPWAGRNDIVVVGPYDAGSLHYEAKSLSTTYFLRASPSTLALRLVEQLLSMGRSRIAVIYAKDDVGRDALPLFEEALASNGIAPTAVIPLEGERWDSTVTERLASDRPNAVLLATAGSQTLWALESIRQAERYGVFAAKAALQFAATKEELRFAPRSARGLFVAHAMPNPYAVTTKISRLYANAVASAPSTPVSYPSLEGCVATLVFAQVMKGANKSLSRSGVVAAFKAERNVELGGWSVDLSDRKLAGSRFTSLMRVGRAGLMVECAPAGAHSHRRGC